MFISPGVSNTCLFAPAPYYKLDKGFFLGFLFKPLSGLRPPRGLSKKASEKHPLSITCCKMNGLKLIIGNIVLHYFYQLGLVKTWNLLI